MSMEIIRRTACGFILLLVCSGARTAPLLPEHEWRMFRQIAANYRLSEEVHGRGEVVHGSGIVGGRHNQEALQGDLDAFGRRYCPPNAVCWARRIRRIIAALKAENPDRLSENHLSSS